MLRLLLFNVLTTSILVLTIGPSYWWLASAYILLCYILDEFDRRTLKG